MRMGKLSDMHRLEADENGMITLDAEAKGMLLQILSDGKFSKETGHRLSIKMGLAVITYFVDEEIPESSLCSKGIGGLVDTCRNCAQVGGCFYWREYGSAYTRDAKILNAVKEQRAGQTPAMGMPPRVKPKDTADE